MYTYEKIEERIMNGKKVTVIIRANTPSQSAIKRCVKTMSMILVQVEQRQNQKNSKVLLHTSKRG
ncbi:hypothetical protein [Clostridium felsineum]|uniref:hypothetical protein n=1 Tax=Clostridium felsineum TaxID=36839 RepID=UPI00098C5CD5|nr:hypothetical protein [Clostridium felsineum]URZ03019.1 hypothetical protein CLAUR_030650 [Clostridium felsineum]